jgi:cyclopropane fatty-acyl-phospholipid synthase-like methyltransferase
MRIPHPEYNVWEHFRESLFPLYAQRARGETSELTCHAQCVEVIGPYLKPGMTLMDVGCGAGDFAWSFHRRGLEIEYHGIDFTQSYIDLGRANLPPEVLPPGRLQLGAASDLTGQYDAVVCINTMQCFPDFREPVERMCRAARRVVYLRTSLDEHEQIRYEKDDYVDEGYKDWLRSYFNIFAVADVSAFMESEGFQVSRIVDERTRDGVEMSAGKPFPWKVLLGVRRGGT